MLVRPGNTWAGDSPGDYDLFLVARNAKNAVKLVTAVLQVFLHCALLREVILTARAITFVCRSLTAGSTFRVQIILRTFATVADVLLSFDMPGCQIAFDGATVVYSGMHRLARAWGVQVVLGAATTQSRILKYGQRGMTTVTDCGFHQVGKDTSAPADSGSGPTIIGTRRRTQGVALLRRGVEAMAPAVQQIVRSNHNMTTLQWQTVGTTPASQTSLAALAGRKARDGAFLYRYARVNGALHHGKA
jgi:hypothetical protein